MTYLEGPETQRSPENKENSDDNSNSDPALQNEKDAVMAKYSNDDGDFDAIEAQSGDQQAKELKDGFKEIKKADDAILKYKDELAKSDWYQTEEGTVYCNNPALKDANINGGKAKAGDFHVVPGGSYSNAGAMSVTISRFNGTAWERLGKAHIRYSGR